MTEPEVRCLVPGCDWVKAGKWDRNAYLWWHLREDHKQQELPANIQILFVDGDSDRLLALSDEKWGTGP